MGEFKVLPFMGRPSKLRVFETVDQLNDKIEVWKEERKAEGLPLTVESLAESLGVIRDTFYKIVRGDTKIREDFLYILKKAHDACIKSNVDALYRKGVSPIGPIFYLKNNTHDEYGYRDKTEVEHSGSLSIAGVFNKVSPQDEEIDAIEAEYTEIDD